uniref:Uncharacterized protein n=1 Tax=Cacopsylla melanoneura TaxID=428564 RepID=A0A8D9AMY8_9HEMI
MKCAGEQNSRWLVLPSAHLDGKIMYHLDYPLKLKMLQGHINTLVNARVVLTYGYVNSVIKSNQVGGKYKLTSKYFHKIICLRNIVRKCSHKNKENNVFMLNNRII